MKVSTLLMLIIILGGAYYYWHHIRPDKTPEPVIADVREESPPDFSSPFREAPAPRALPEPPPKPPPVEATLIQEEIIEGADTTQDSRITPQAIRDTLALQRAVEVPHPLNDARTMSGVEYQNASVFRVEPDGIQIRHAEGITKIPLEEMQPEWRDQYHMNRLIAAEYRARQAQRDHAAWQAAQERLRLQHERERQTLHEGHLATEERRQARQSQREAAELQSRRDAWAKYDHDLAEWRRRNARYSPTRGWVEIDRPGVVGAGRPRPPPFPRP